MTRNGRGRGAVLGILTAGAIFANEMPTPDLWQPQQGGTSSGGGFTMSGDLQAYDVLTNEVQQLSFEPLYWTMTVAPIMTIQPAPDSVVITWPASLAHWELEVSTNLTSRPTLWSALMPLRETNGTWVSVRVPISTTTQLYRLHQK